MYTGIVEGSGTIESIDRDDGGVGVRVGCEFDGIEPDDSVAVAGVCLTATEAGDGWFEADLSTETVERTYLGSVEPGRRVNLERPLPADGRFDGHVLKGTVDATTEVLRVEEAGDGWTYTVATPPDYAPMVVEKGAVGLDGVSLTVADVHPASFEVAVVPHTREVTTLDRTGPGDPLHFEADVLAKYVRSHAGATDGLASRG